MTTDVSNSTNLGVLSMLALSLSAKLLAVCMAGDHTQARLSYAKATFKNHWQEKPTQTVLPVYPWLSCSIGHGLAASGCACG